MRRDFTALRALAAIAATTLLLAAPARAQTQPAADPADVASIDAIMHAIYDVISGPVGQARNWDRWHSLFMPGARLIPTGKGPDGVVRSRVMSAAEYVSSNGDGLSSVGFMEIEIARRVEQFGNIAHVFSTYESKFTRNGEPATDRGINSVQLINDGSRWWVYTIMWDAERPDNPIPAKYLSGGN